MATYGTTRSTLSTEPRTKAEFYKIAGITPRLAKWVDEFIQRPEILKTLPLETQHQIEAQIDAVLNQFSSSGSPCL